MLVDGDYTVDSTFLVNEMGHPPSEKRSVSMFVVLLQELI